VSLHGVSPRESEDMWWDWEGFVKSWVLSWEWKSEEVMDVSKYLIFLRPPITCRLLSSWCWQNLTKHNSLILSYFAAVIFCRAKNSSPRAVCVSLWKQFVSAYMNCCVQLEFLRNRRTRMESRRRQVNAEFALHFTKTWVMSRKQVHSIGLLTLRYQYANLFSERYNTQFH